MSSQQRRVKSYFCTISVFVQFSLFKKRVHGPGPKPFYKNKKVSITRFMTGGSMEPVQSGGPWTPDPCFVLWIQSDLRIEFSNLSFPIVHLPAGRLTCANSGEIFGGGSAIQRVHEWRSPKFSPNSHKWHEPQFAD